MTNEEIVKGQEAARAKWEDLKRRTLEEMKAIDGETPGSVDFTPDWWFEMAAVRRMLSRREQETVA